MKTYHLSDKDSLKQFGKKVRAGKGTEATPYYGDFDHIVRSLPAGATILLEGVEFATRGFYFQRDGQNYSLKRGQRLIGLGADVTTLRIIKPEKGLQIAALFSEEDSIEVCDLGVNCGAELLAGYICLGVILYGNHCAVRRLVVRQSSGVTATDSESWAIMVGHPNLKSIGGVVEGCRLSDFMGDYENGVSIIGTGGRWRDNTVEMPKLTMTEAGVISRPGHYASFNVGGSRRAIIEGNTAIGGYEGFYGESFLESASFGRNHVVDFWAAGFRFRRQLPMTDCSFEQQFISLGRTPGQCAFFFETTGSEGRSDNLDVSRNVIRSQPGVPFHPLILEGVSSNVRFCHNICSANGAFKNCESVSMEGNSILV